MTVRPPLVFGADGLPQQVQVGDQLSADGAEWHAAPVAPSASGVLREGIRTQCGRDMLATRSLQWPEELIQSQLGRTSILGYLCGSGLSAPAAYPGSSGIATVGTVSGRIPTTTTRAGRLLRNSFTSAATAGSFAGTYHNSSGHKFCTIGDGAGLGGFHFIASFVVSDPATVSGAQMFVGLQNNTAAPAAGEPNALTQCIGVGQISTSNNLVICYGGSAAQTSIDLGANFPAGTLSADLYLFEIFSSPFDTTKVYYQVNRNGGANVSGGFTASGTLNNTTPGTTLPASSTTMVERAYRTNNATALAVAIDVGGILTHVPI